MKSSKTYYFFQYFIPIALTITLVMGGVWSLQRQSQIESIQNTEQQHLMQNTLLLNRDIKPFIADLRMMLTLPSLQSLMDKNLDNPETRDALTNRFTQELANFGLTGRLDQIRFLDPMGFEKIRINVVNGTSIIVPKSKLQNKADRYYFTESMKLNKGELFISSMDLNIENGKIEVPFKPVLRFSAPVIDYAGRTQGVIVLNGLGSHILSALRQDFSDTAAIGYMSDDEGQWLISPDEDAQWGNTLPHGRSFKTDFPDIWLEAQKSEFGTLVTEQGIFSYRSVYPLIEAKQALNIFASFERPELRTHKAGYRWILLSHYPRDLFPSLLHGTGANLLAIYVFLLLASIVTCYYIASYRFARAQSETIAREAQKSLEYAQQLAHIGNWKFDQQNSTLEVSDEFLRICKLPLGNRQIKYEEFLAVAHPGDVGNIGNIFLQLQNKTESCSCDFRLMFSDQGIRYVHMLGASVDGQTSGTLQDITERRTAEHEIKVREAEFRDFAMASSDWFWKMGPDLRINYLSDNFRKIMKIDPSVLIGKRREEFASAEQVAKDPVKWERHFDDLKSHVAFHDFEYDSTLDDGRIVSISVSGVPFFDDDGKFLGYRGTGSNITSRRINEINILESRERLQSIINNTADGIITIDDRGLIEMFNPAAEKIFGYTTDEIIGTNVSLLLPAGERPQHDKYIKDSTLTAPRIINQARDLQGRRKNGDLFPMELNVSHMTIGGNKKFIGIFRDITERITAMNNLRQAKDEAENASRAKSEFLSSMSHELRTPLNAIIGFGQLLESDFDAPLNEEQLESVEQILKGGKHLLSLINEVLDLARIESGRIPLSIESVELEQVISQAMVMATSMADQRQISITNNAQSSSVGISVFGDYTRLKQVMLNLLSNAVKYNNVNGTITVDFEITDNKMARVSVSDTGVGIPENKHKNVFQPFSRLGFEGSAIEGTGIGLTITKDLMQMMSGDVGFTSEEGKGSTFWFDIPLSTNEQAVLAAEHAAEQQESKPNKSQSEYESSHKGRVLYVEDNPANQKLMEKLVSRINGIELLMASTGEEGVKLAGEQHPDLILMDINLPGINGFEALKQLKDSEKTREIPVIAVSANAMKQDIQTGMDAGFVDYLTKPYQVDKLTYAILQAISH